MLLDNGVEKIIDTRRNNSSQLAGFAKGKDLAYLAQAISNIGYEHKIEMAPSQDLLQAWRKKEVDWVDYETRYVEEIQQSKFIEELDKDTLHNACLLCSEHEPDFCHRRLLADYLKKYFHEIEIIHLT